MNPIYVFALTLFLVGIFLLATFVFGLIRLSLAIMGDPHDDENYFICGVECEDA